MPYSDEGKLVVAISSRALFDFEEENRIFESDGEAAYIALHFARLDVPARAGAAGRGGDPVEKRSGVGPARVQVGSARRAGAGAGGVHARPQPVPLPRCAEGESVPVGERSRRDERAGCQGAGG